MEELECPGRRLERTGQAACAGPAGDDIYTGKQVIRGVDTTQLSHVQRPFEVELGRLKGGGDVKGTLTSLLCE